jgi:hypothetical protein
MFGWEFILFLQGDLMCFSSGLNGDRASLKSKETRLQFSNLGECGV